MVQSFKLSQRQAQALVMTPQLQQAIKLLQLSNIELVDYVTQEVERNPLLKCEETGDDGNISLSDIAAAEEGSGDRERNPSLHRSEEGNAEVDNAYGEDGDAAERISATGHESLSIDGVLDGVDASVTAASALDVDFNSEWNDSRDGMGAALPSLNRIGAGRGFDDDGSDEHSIPANEVTLRGHLLAQLGAAMREPADRLIGACLIDMLEETGYFPGDLAEVAEKLGCDKERVVAVFARLQTFEPSGIFARSLSECLALQLAERNRLDPAMKAMLDRLDLVAKRDISGLARACGVGADDITDMIREIRALNPKPGISFDAAPAAPVVPDILLRPLPGGGWAIDLNPDTLPRVLIDVQYHVSIRDAARTKEERQYVAEQLKSANWLVKSLHQRATTILKVASEIVRRQGAFFAKGVAHLKPMVLRDIAEAIGMHESTISRVTSNKYVMTPFGAFELKYFFSAALSSSTGAADHSARTVQQRIRSLIDTETPDAILTDEQLAVILLREGVKIARRTVTKYREGMGIPRAAQRQVEKKIEPAISAIALRKNDRCLAAQ